MKGTKQMMSKKACSKYTSIGGQAVIEGIMMKGPKKSVLSVRLPDGDILTEDVTKVPLKEKYKCLGWPLLRGVAGFIESMATGYKILMRSAELAATEEEEKTEKQKEEKTPKEKKKEENSNGIFALVATLASILGIALSVVIFFYIPSLLFNLLKSYTGEGIAGYRGLIEGMMKFIMFISYIWVVSLMKEIHRVFQYHGAEHKSIFCYEAREELTVENVRKQSRFHPRCGTSFMILMIVVGITISTIVIKCFPGLTTNIVTWVFFKILLIPVFCAFGYELLKLCGKYDNIFT